MTTLPSRHHYAYLQMRINTQLLFISKLDLQEASLRGPYMCMLMGDDVGGKATLEAKERSQ